MASHLDGVPPPSARIPVSLPWCQRAGPKNYTIWNSNF